MRSFLENSIVGRAARVVRFVGRSREHEIPKRRFAVSGFPVSSLR